jgi:hypothetical protein
MSKTSDVRHGKDLQSLLRQALRLARDEPDQRLTVLLRRAIIRVKIRKRPVCR